MVDNQVNEQTSKRTIEFPRGDDDALVSTWELARFHAGELDDERQREIEGLAAQDAVLAARIKDLDDERSAFAARMPFARFEADFEQRKSRGSFAKLTAFAKLAATVSLAPFQRGLLPAASVLGACALMLFVVVGGGPDKGTSTRTKGGAELSFFVQDGETARLGRAGEQLSAGDRIQFAVRDDVKAKSMVIVGIDGTGAVTLYARDAIARDKGGAPISGPRILPRSIILDDAKGIERFFVLYADESVSSLSKRATESARSVVASGTDISTLKRLPLSVVAQGSVHIVKE